MPHPPLVAAPAFVPRVLPSATLALMANFLALIDDFPSLVDDFSSLIDGCQALMRTVSPPTLSLVDALFTYGHAIAHRQVNIASIRLGGRRRVRDSTRAGGMALLWWYMVLFREVAWNRAQIRAHICARMRAQAPAASMAATKNRLATLTVVRRHLTSSLGGHEEQRVLFAVTVVKRKL